jgi:cation transport regulator ChaB
MLKPTRIAQTPTTQELVQHWADRYRTDLQRLSITTDPLILEEYIKAAHPLNRLQTVERIRRSLHLYCELGAVNTVALFSISENVVNLTEAKRLSQFVQQVYVEILAIYAQQTSSLTLSSPLPVEKMADAMESVLLQLQEQHHLAKDPRTIGFLTTQFHLSTQVILRYCSVYERVWLKPYFQFIEEQVCIPWQRICAAAQHHGLRSPAFRLVATLLPLSQLTAKRVYQSALAQYPDHQSRRGTLSKHRVAASTLRDLNMFQAYLCLCVLEGSMDAIASELLPLCQLVFPSIEIKWDLIEGCLQFLVSEIHAVLTAEQQDLIRFYTSSLSALFTPVDESLFENDPDELDDMDDLENLDHLAHQLEHHTEPQRVPATTRQPGLISMTDLPDLGDLDLSNFDLDTPDLGAPDLSEPDLSEPDDSVERATDLYAGLYQVAGLSDDGLATEQSKDSEENSEENSEDESANQVATSEDEALRAAIATEIAKFHNIPIAEDMAMI